MTSFGTHPLSKRDAEAWPFSAALTVLDAPRTDTPTKLPRPDMTGAPSVKDNLAKPPTSVHHEFWPLLSNLDGHEHSGKDAPMPATRGEANEYIEQRIAAHEKLHGGR